MKEKKSEAPRRGNEELFKWNGNPTFGQILPLAAQHVLAAVVGCVTPAILVANAANNAGGNVNMGLLIQMSLVFAALSTFLQLYGNKIHLGSGLPVIIGVSFAYVPTMTAIAAQAQDVNTIFGAMIVGGIVAIIVGLTIKQIRKVFPPLVIGTVIFAIGLSLYKTAINYMAGNSANTYEVIVEQRGQTAALVYGSWQNWLVSLVTLAIVIGLNHYGKGLFKLASILIGLVCTNLGEAWRMAEGADASEKLLSFFTTMGAAFGNPLPSLHPLDLMVGLICGAGFRAAVYIRGKNAKNFKHNLEYGSARWGGPKDIEPFMDPVFANNVILTKTERLMMSNRPKNPANARNKNVLIVGGSGSGKTRFWLKPNLMQMHSSYVVTDPKGTILVECGKMLQRGTPKLGKDGKPMKDKHGKVIYEPYRIKVLNTINFKKSMHYNPFAYIHSEKDILKLVTTLIANTKGEGKAGDDFWVKAETLLYCALIGYIHYEAPVEEQNFSTLIEMINSMEVREDDEEYKNAVDLMFDELESRDPRHFAVRQYKKYKLAAGKTAKSILISCGARLAVFDIAELREVTSYDELELDTLGDQKTALFLIMSDTDDSFNFLISMCYTQLFNLLCEKADDVYGGRLPVHVRCLIDECANIGQIPRLEKLVATIRSREISACLVLQAQSQLKAIYKDNADTIIGNMDTSIFLGGKEPTTLKELAAVLGKETIDTYNTGESRGRETSHSLNYQKLGKELMSQDELAVMDGGRCILQLRGVRPFLSDKYDITKHPNFKYTADADPKNAFDIEAFLSTRLKLKPNEVYDVYEVDAEGA